MDLSNYDLAAKAEAGSEVKILEPKTDKETDIVIRVVGANSAKYRNATVAALVDYPMPDDADSETLAEIHFKRNAVKFSACVTGWENIELDGKVLEYSRENARLIVERFYWIADQVGAHLSNDENFTGA